MSEADRQIYTDTDINAYQGYIPDDWGERVIGPIPEGTVLERLVLDLALSWRTASYTAQMPAISIRVMHAAAVGRGKFTTPDASIVRFADGIIGRLAFRVPSLAVDRALGNRLVNELVTIATEFRDSAAAVKADFPIEPIWADFMTQAPFRLSLWASQRIAYVAFYNAYEAFLVDCAMRALGVDRLRATEKAFLEALRTAFGPDLTGPCWTHHEIHIAREVRHSLSHAGGRETVKLRKQRHGIEMRDGVLQIIPRDIHRMLARLRTAAETLVAAAAGNPQFAAKMAELLPSEEE